MLSIVTTSKDVRKTTANLQGPLAINVRTCRGKQVLCEGEGYPVRYRIWEALDRLAEREQRNNDAIKGEARRAPAAA
jgi:flagellar assembly factor FliW